MGPGGDISAQRWVPGALRIVLLVISERGAPTWTSKEAAQGVFFSTAGK